MKARRFELEASGGVLHAARKLGRVAVIVLASTTAVGRCHLSCVGGWSSDVRAVQGVRGQPRRASGSGSLLRAMHQETCTSCLPRAAKAAAAARGTDSPLDPAAAAPRCWHRRPSLPRRRRGRPFNLRPHNERYPRHQLERALRRQSPSHCSARSKLFTENRGPARRRHL